MIETFSEKIMKKQFINLIFCNSNGQCNTNKISIKNTQNLEKLKWYNPKRWYRTIMRVKPSFNWDLSVIDEAKFTNEFEWTKAVTVFLVDYIRANVRIGLLKDGKLKAIEAPPPLKWVAWRFFAITVSLASKSLFEKDG